jgi:hypothetical protein
MTNPTPTSSYLEKPRRRLFSQHRKLGSWWKVAEARGVNRFYVYDFAVNGNVPVNKKIQRALGIPRLPHPITINQLMHLPIQDMPGEILKLALENREEMK